MTITNKTNTKPIKNRGIRDATLNALAGFRCLLAEPAARRELGLFAMSAIICIDSVSTVKLILLFIALLMLVIESLNTALEKLCDVITRDYDQRIKNIKDLGASAVFILSVAYGVTFTIFVLELLE